MSTSVKIKNNNKKLSLSQIRSPFLKRRFSLPCGQIVEKWKIENISSKKFSSIEEEQEDQISPRYIFKSGQKHDTCISSKRQKVHLFTEQKFNNLMFNYVKPFILILSLDLSCIAVTFTRAIISQSTGIGIVSVGMSLFKRSNNLREGLKKSNNYYFSGEGGVSLGYSGRMWS